MAAAASALVGALSCRQIAGISEDPPTKLTASACGLPWGTDLCASCAASNCCSEATACAGDSICLAHFTCLGACAPGDLQCRTQCLLDHPVGASPGYAPLTACAARACESACGLTCGALDYFVPPSAAPACQACLSGSPCAAERACASSVDCVAYAQCMRLCSTPDCRVACSARVDGGLLAATADAGLTASLVPYLAAVDPTGQCNAACKVGGNWACVGHLRLPEPTTGSTTLTAIVYEQITSKAPVAGVDVSLCPPVGQCSAPTVSGPQGYVALPVAGTPLGISSGDYVQVTSPSGSIYPALYFMGYPVSRPVAPIAEPYLTVLTPSDVDLLASLLGVDAGSGESTGIAGFEVLDCNGFPASGVVVQMDPTPAPPAVEFYGATPSVAAMATDSSGVGGFASVPPGTVTLTAAPAGLGKVSTRASVLVKAGAESVVFLLPNQ